MKGATALDCENTINRPKSTNTMMIGISQYFFSWRRNAQNSPRTRPLVTATRHNRKIVAPCRVFNALRVSTTSVPLSTSAS